ncbi:ZZ-type zinc finger-containing protein 3 isoform X2 [Zootermopsis nevadensis]|uniref:ZZ-type zinc finger-containing protein 3 isoform X2 n=1 Tax=Zootermopsis nevadensis TaxID=136037 RepID=UPI000B8EBA8D|nr:ZZ-type zinc finger-containing protein 3 isoform X2 [Zootermopsis nevadensis]
MESLSSSPNMSAEATGEIFPNTSPQNARYLEENSDNTTEFYFESDHLALKGNGDYLNLLKTIAVLESQRTKAIQDYDKLLAIQEAAMQDPMKFVEKLQRGEDLGIPVPQVIEELPVIDWSSYNVTVPTDSLKPLTRKDSNRHAGTSLDSVMNTEHDSCDLKSKILVRGRPFDDSKPETFNQLWTAEEQRRLEELLVEYPPEEVESRRWQKIAAALGNRTTKQVCSRVQKYFIKLHKAGLPVPGRSPKLQSLDIFRKGYHPHRHQKNNHYLLKQTTFFPSQDVPVYMSDYDDETVGSCTNISTGEYGTKMEDRLSDDDINAAQKHENSAEYQQLCLLRRVKRDKEMEKGRFPVEHLGYKDRMPWEFYASLISI